MTHRLRELLEQQILERNAVSSVFFSRESDRLARVCHRMSDRFGRGGRLLAFGSGASASDAQHVAVEFVHPILVGKRALPALDLSFWFRARLPAVLRPDDIVMGFGPPGGDPDVAQALAYAAAHGAMTLALPGTSGDYAADAPSPDPFIHQEIFEVLYHTLWETVHVFFEHQPLPHAAGTAAFLYPFLGHGEWDAEHVTRQVAASILSKAACDADLRQQVVTGQGDAIVAAAIAVHERAAEGGTILCFGNGGSATDATDFALDCVASPKGYPPMPAVSLAMDSATLTALANDIGTEGIFMRQVIAHGRPQDMALAISTSGGSANVISALAEARARGLLTIGLLGYDGGEIVRRGLVDHAVVVPSDQIPRVQEVQASIYHVMLDLLSTIAANRGTPRRRHDTAN